MAARPLNVGIVVPLLLAFAVGVLVYLYGSARSQYSSAALEVKGLYKDLAVVRSEKESLQFELNTERDQLERASKEKNRVLERAENAEDKVQQVQAELDKLRTNVNQLQTELDKAKEAASELESNKDKAKSDLATYITKWKLCEAGKAEAEKQGRERASENDDLVESLRQEVDTLRIEKTEAEKKGKELEKGLGVCENKRKSLQLQVDKNDRLQKQEKEKAKEKEKEKAKEKEQEKEALVEVDDRAVELLPPAPVGGNGQLPPAPVGGNGQLPPAPVGGQGHNAPDDNNQKPPLENKQPS